MVAIDTYATVTCRVQHKLYTLQNMVVLSGTDREVATLFF